MIGALHRRALESKFLQHVSFMTSANAVSAGLGVLQGVLVARWLGPESYGLATLVIGFPALVFALFDVRSYEASVKFISEFRSRGEHQKVAALMALATVLDIIVAIAAFLIILALASVAVRMTMHSSFEIQHLIPLYAISFIPRSFKWTAYAALSLSGGFARISLMETTAVVFRVSVVLVAVGMGWGIPGFVFGSAVAHIVEGALFAWAGREVFTRTWNLSWQGLRSWDTLRGERREILRFLFLNDALSLFTGIIKLADIFVLGYFRSLEEVGFYRIAKTFSGAVGYVIGPLQAVSYAKFTAAMATGEAAFRSFMVRFLLQIGLPAGIVLAFAAPQLAATFLPMVFGKNYESAVMPATILLWASSAWLAGFWIRPAYLARGRFRFWLASSFVTSACMLASYWYTAPRWGTDGMAWSYLILSVAYHAFLCAGLAARTRIVR